MTYRKKFYEINKIDSPYLNKTAIFSIFTDVAGFSGFTDLVKHFDDEIEKEAEIDAYLNRIIAGEPLQYVLGHAFFVHGEYKVTPDVLIPRQETEELMMMTLKRIGEIFGFDKKITIADIGTGSGILAVSLKLKLKNAKMIATDISDKCLEVAKENAATYKVDIDFRQGNMLEPIKEKLDVIISNPPYIENESTVDPQTLKYEPHLALFANPKIKYYKEILSHIDQMNDEFLIAFEIGEDMKKELTDLLESEYIGVGYSFAEDIYRKTRFLFVFKFKGIEKYDKRKFA